MLTWVIAKIILLSRTGSSSQNWKFGNPCREQLQAPELQPSNTICLGDVFQWHPNWSRCNHCDQELSSTSLVALVQLLHLICGLSALAWQCALLSLAASIEHTTISPSQGMGGICCKRQTKHAHWLLDNHQNRQPLKLLSFFCLGDSSVAHAASHILALTTEKERPGPQVFQLLELAGRSQSGRQKSTTMNCYWSGIGQFFHTGGWRRGPTLLPWVFWKVGATLSRHQAHTAHAHSQEGKVVQTNHEFSWCSNSAHSQPPTSLPWKLSAPCHLFKWSMTDCVFVDCIGSLPLILSLLRPCLLSVSALSSYLSVAWLSWILLPISLWVDISGRCPHLVLGCSSSSSVFFAVQSCVAVVVVAYVLLSALRYGIGIGFAMHAAPTYIAEISPASVRGVAHLGEREHHSVLTIAYSKLSWPSSCP